MGAAVTANEMAGKVERDFFGGSIRLHILYHAASGKVFGQGLMDELQHHGYRLSPGTRYPSLHALERGGYLRSTLKQVAGNAASVSQPVQERTRWRRAGTRSWPCLTRFWATRAVRQRQADALVGAVSRSHLNSSRPTRTPPRTRTRRRPRPHV